MISAATLPATITPDALVHQMEWRYATKQFDPSRRIDP